MSTQEADGLVRGIAWLGTRTAHFEEMVAFARDVLGFSLTHHGNDIAAFTLPNGDQFDVFAPDDGGSPPFDAPVAGFRVENIEAARAALEAQGVVFPHPIERFGDIAWTHFRAPDGFVYEITSRPIPSASRRQLAGTPPPLPRTAERRKADTLALLAREVDCWVASADKRGEPYLIPLSFAWDGERLTLATPRASRTARNLRRSGRTRVTLGPTRDVVILDGTIDEVARDADDTLADHFAAATGFDPRALAGEDYVYLRFTPRRIQAWREANELPGRDLMRDGRWLV